MKSKFDEYEIKVDTLYQSGAKISEEFKSEIDNLLGLIEHKICETRVSIFKRQFKNFKLLFSDTHIGIMIIFELKNFKNNKNKKQESRVF